MKKLLILFAFVFRMTTIVHAQVKESFDSNSWQWTEYSADMGHAYIIDGVMRLESRSDNYNNISLKDIVGSIATHSFLPMDPAKGFTLECTATLEKFER